MLLGTPNSSSPTSQNVFEDFIVYRNMVTYAASLSYAGKGILVNMSSTARFDFVRLRCSAIPSPVPRVPKEPVLIPTHGGRISAR